MGRKTQWFASSEGAELFMAGKRNASVTFSGGGSGWLVAWDEPEEFDRIVSRNGGDGKVEAPVEIVHRQRVVGLSVADMEDETLTVTMETRFFTVTKEQAQLFKVGSEIEVVLRPKPLA